MTNVWENADLGVKRKVFDPGEKLMMMEVRFEAGAEGYEHSHPHEQISYCIKGKVEFIVDGNIQLLTAGETIVISGNAKHGVKALEASTILDCFTPLREDLL